MQSPLNAVWQPSLVHQPQWLRYHEGLIDRGPSNRFSCGGFLRLNVGFMVTSLTKYVLVFSLIVIANLMLTVEKVLMVPKFPFYNYLALNMLINSGQFIVGPLVNVLPSMT